MACELLLLDVALFM